ncbi:MAG: PEP-utilizing enzyme [Desulfopila sp.]
MWGKRDSTARHDAAGGEIDVWRLQALVNNFRRILELNNDILAEMSQLERTLGGEFIFDTSFLENAVRSLSAKVHHLTYSLNALTGNGYISLYDTYQEIRMVLDDILVGNTKALSTVPVLPLQEVGWELEQLVGVDLVCLAELRHHSTLQAADGFVVTSGGTWIVHERPALKRANYKGFTAAEVRTGLQEQFRRLLASEPPRRFAVIASQIDDQVDQVSEIARFFLIPNHQETRVEIATDPPSFIELPFRPFAREQQEDQAGERWVERYRHAVEEIIHLLLSYGQAENGGGNGLVVLFVRDAPQPLVQGTVETRRSEKERIDSLRVFAHSQPEPGTSDMYRLRRTYPFELIQSTIPARSAEYRFADGQVASGRSVSRSGYSCIRGSALLSSVLLCNLAETAITLERLLGLPVTIEWELLADGRCHITGLYQMQATLDLTAADELAEAEGAAVVLCQGGHMVQSGVGAGRVVHVDLEMTPGDFPVGAVAVARFASPRLTPILQRAAAIVTEHGTAMGHLATVARELRLPAIFGIGEACRQLAPDSEVTVYADGGRVYQGVIDVLLRKGTGELSFSPFDQEYRQLRRLLRFIMPQHLGGSAVAEWSEGNCRCLYDLIRYCHDRAVDELAHLQERRPALGAIRTRWLELGVPVEIRVLDIGGGLTGETGSRLVAGDVRSAPLVAFLTGLLRPEAWGDVRPAQGLRDLVASLPRSMGMLTGSSLRDNLAIAGDAYLNINLKMGCYRHSVDAHLGRDESRNYVYFRSMGERGDRQRRNRRSPFIREVLTAMNFRVVMADDQVIGRLRSDRPEILRAALSVLGALIACLGRRGVIADHDGEATAVFTGFSQVFVEEFRQVFSTVYGI